MSQFSQVYTAGATEAVGTIADQIVYNQQTYNAVIGEETYQNTLGEGGFEPARTVQASVLLAGAPDFRMGGRVEVNGRQYRIVGINTDAASVDLTLQSPETR